MAVFSAASALKYSLARRAAVSRSAMVSSSRLFRPPPRSARSRASATGFTPEKDGLPRRPIIPGRVGLVQQPQHLLRLRLRPEAEGPLLGLGADRLLRKQLQHPGQLQGADGFVK